MEVLGEEKAAVADMPKMPFVLATIAEVGFLDMAKKFSDMFHVLTCSKCSLF